MFCSPFVCIISAVGFLFSAPWLQRKNKSMTSSFLASSDPSLCFVFFCFFTSYLLFCVFRCKNRTISPFTFLLSPSCLMLDVTSYVLSTNKKKKSTFQTLEGRKTQPEGPSDVWQEQVVGAVTSSLCHTFSFGAEAGFAVWCCWRFTAAPVWHQTSAACSLFSGTASAASDSVLFFLRRDEFSTKVRHIVGPQWGSGGATKSPD